MALKSIELDLLVPAETLYFGKSSILVVDCEE